MHPGVGWLLVLAASGPGSASYTIERWTMDAGGQQAASANHGASSSLGQPDASGVLASPAYRLVGGFQGLVLPSEPRADAVFADGFETTLAPRAANATRNLP